MDISTFEVFINLSCEANHAGYWNSYVRWISNGIWVNLNLMSISDIVLVEDTPCLPFDWTLIWMLNARIHRQKAKI